MPSSALGLALAIDYSLFLVSRYREEMRKGTDREQAIITTVNTAGRTVLFSSLTVALSLAALSVFPMYFLKSFAYAGLAVVRKVMPTPAGFPRRAGVAKKRPLA